jgi:hypothetical protein
MEDKGNYWMTNSQMVKYQSMLCENPHIRLEVKTLNPATLLLVDSGSTLREVMDEVFLSWPDLTDQPVGNMDIDCFTDGNSFVWDDTHFAGYAVVTVDLVIEACPLLVGISAQKAKLVTLVLALQPHCRSTGKHLH